MEHFTWWLTIALCFSFLSASQALDFMDTNPKEVNGAPIFEGDILLNESQWRAFRERKSLLSLSSRWPEGTDGYPEVPYVFGDDYVNRATIKKAMDHWSAHTCLKFSEATDISQPHVRFVYGYGCYSPLGRIEQEGQDISVGLFCNDIDIVVHEIGHAIGFVHEQGRPDRDDFVQIFSMNTAPSLMPEFQKYPASFVNSQGIPYDYSSVMHKSSTAYSINGKTTIATEDPFAQAIIGQWNGLSHRDKHAANLMYNCINKWLAKCNKSSDPCQNGGYYGADCACVCPPGTSGSNCETITGNYYDSVTKSCTEKITTEGVITSPNYPNNYPAIQCVKWIEAPECHVPILTFSAFKLHERSSYCYGLFNCCYFDALEIRTSNRYTGDVFCDNDMWNGRSVRATGREMILFFRTVSNYYQGFSATLTFERDTSCNTEE